LEQYIVTHLFDIGVNKTTMQKRIALYTGVARNFANVILVTFFGDVMVMTSLKWRYNCILEFDFVIISLKNHNLAKSRNFRSPILKV